MNIMDIINKAVQILTHDKFILLVVWLLIGDTILGVLRAFKEHKLNSCVGIDGVIRKIAMLVSLIGLTVIDVLFEINTIGFLPEQVKNTIGVSKVGLCEFFALCLTFFEALSILKNWTILGIWLPKKLKTAIYSWLKNMTDELPKEFLEYIDGTNNK